MQHTTPHCNTPPGGLLQHTAWWVTATHRLVGYCNTPPGGLLGMGWLRLVGPLKLQVSFAKEPYQRDDILQKRDLQFEGDY